MWLQFFSNTFRKAFSLQNIKILVKKDSLSKIRYFVWHFKLFYNIINTIMYVWWLSFPHTWHNICFFIKTKCVIKTTSKIWQLKKRKLELSLTMKFCLRRKSCWFDQVGNTKKPKENSTHSRIPSFSHHTHTHTHTHTERERGRGRVFQITFSKLIELYFERITACGVTDFGNCF